MTNSMENCKITHAKIRFIENGEKQVVDVHSIIEFQQNPPQNKNDFEVDKLYTCLYQDKKYPELTEYGVQIGRLYDETEGKLHRKRVAFPTLETSIVDRYYDGNQSVIGKKTNIDSGEEDVVQNKAKQKEVKIKTKTKDKKNQQSILDDKIKTYMSTETLTLPHRPTVLLKDVAIEHEKTNETTDSETYIKKPKKTTENKTDDKVDKVNKDYKLNLEINKIKLELKNLQMKHENLLKKYNEKNERLECLQTLNERLQNMLFEMKSGNDDGVKSNNSEHNSLKLSGYTSPPVSPIGYKKQFLPKIANCSSPLPAHEEHHVDNHSDKRRYHRTVLSPKIDTDFINKTDYSPDFDKSNFGEDIENNKKAPNCKKTERLDKTVDNGDFDQEPGCSHQVTPKSSRQKRIHSQTKESANCSEEENEEPAKKKNKIQLMMTDDSTEGKKFLEKFVKDGIKMVYLRHDYSMPYDDWKNAFRSKSQSLFSKKLLRYFYSPSDLKRRCIKEGDKTRTPNGVNKRIVISPKKTSAMTKALEYFIKKTDGSTSQEAMDAKIAKITHYFSEEINAQKKKVK